MVANDGNGISVGNKRRYASATAFEKRATTEIKREPKAWTDTSAHYDPYNSTFPGTECAMFSTKTRLTIRSGRCERQGVKREYSARGGGK